MRICAATCAHSQVFTKICVCVCSPTGGRADGVGAHASHRVQLHFGGHPGQVCCQSTEPGERVYAYLGHIATSSI